MATAAISSDSTKATSKGAAVADLAKTDNATAVVGAEPVTSAGPNWPPGFRPFHSLRDEESADGTRYNLLKIFCDTPEGRAYDDLVTDEQRLAYMRANHQDNTWHVQPDERIFEDWDEGKCYVVKIRSPEGQALAKLDPPGGEEWEDEKSEGYRAWVDFFKKNASYVEELQPEDRPAACSAEGVGEI
ncbi:hypothetical protein MAPG_02809 [Magnaporthiopsis poae ATCC 64411]|uniref:Uncharacterized protein n=1 Tax=Magnaporthiopsis poae (strain ATCC 64411 / 73-15) TaxID=644358 RepID=A0A0C4DSD1_MAGP6|nr:hypothetical protein MAPG_02809 [Magnaporthiopsis poae ATCC 64411]